MPHNLLSLLEKLATFPTEQSELNTWWVEELGARPPKPKTKKNEDDEEEETDAKNPDMEEDDDADDWRKFFDDQDNEKDPSAEGKTASARLHKLSIHQSLHSLSSHRAVFTRTWLALLPQLSSGSEESSKTLVTRALNVMHRGVMPHLTRAVLVMDWVATCVDYGEWRGVYFYAYVYLIWFYRRNGRLVGLERVIHPHERIQPVSAVWLKT